MSWVRAFTVLLFLVAAFYLSDTMYENFAVLHHMLAPKTKLLWAVVPLGAPQGLEDGLRRAARDLCLDLRVFRASHEFAGTIDSVYLPELVIWWGLVRADVPALRDLLRNAVTVAVIDPQTATEGTVSVRLPGGSEAARFRQGYWAACSVAVSVKDFIFFQGDTTKQ